MFTVEELRTIALALALSDLDERGILEAKVDALIALGEALREDMPQAGK